MKLIKKVLLKIKRIFKKNKMTKLKPNQIDPIVRRFLSKVVTLNASELGNSGTTKILALPTAVGKFNKPIYMVSRFTGGTTGYTGFRKLQLLTVGSGHLIIDDDLPGWITSAATLDLDWLQDAKVLGIEYDDFAYEIGFDTDDLTGDGTLEVEIFYEQTDI